MSSRTLRGRGTANSAAPPTSPRGFAAIRQRLRGAITGFILAVSSPMYVPLNAHLLSSLPGLRRDEESGYYSTPTTPPTSSEKWDGSHLYSRYGIASAFADVTDDDKWPTQWPGGVELHTTPDLSPDDEFHTTTFAPLENQNGPASR